MAPNIAHAAFALGARVANTMAETVIARIPPRLAVPYTSGHKAPSGAQDRILARNAQTARASRSGMAI